MGDARARLRLVIVRPHEDGRACGQIRLNMRLGRPRLLRLITADAALTAFLSRRRPGRDRRDGRPAGHGKRSGVHARPRCTAPGQIWQLRDTVRLPVPVQNKPSGVANSARRVRTTRQALDHDERVAARPPSRAADEFGEQHRLVSPQRDVAAGTPSAPVKHHHRGLVTDPAMQRCRGAEGVEQVRIGEQCARRGHRARTRVASTADQRRTCHCGSLLNGRRVAPACQD